MGPSGFFKFLEIFLHRVQLLPQMLYLSSIIFQYLVTTR